MKANIKLSLSLLTPLKLLALLNNVIAKLMGNADFATPAVPVADLKALSDELTVAIENATRGGQQQRIIRDQLVAQVGEKLRIQADYVRSVGAGDPAKLESSGFELRKTPEPVGVPSSPRKMEARMTGLKGSVKLLWSSSRGAYGYQIWMTDKDPSIDGNWEAIGYTTRVSHIVTDLESYKAYWFCVSPIGSAGEGAQCDPALGRAA